LRYKEGDAVKKARLLLIYQVPGQPVSQISGDAVGMAKIKVPPTAIVFRADRLTYPAELTDGYYYNGELPRDLTNKVE